MNRPDDITIKVAEWTKTPGPRNTEQGHFSAELFWQQRLGEAAERVFSSGGTLTIDLDGVAGYGASFLEETFGGLARKYGTDEVTKHLKIVCTEDRYTLEDAWGYVRNPRPAKRPAR